MDFLPTPLADYVELYTQAEDDVLKKLNRETNANIQYPRMLSGHLQGQILKMFSKMIRPSNILEIGTYTGYSAICLSAGLRNNGKLHSIEINPELEEMIQKYINLAGLKEKVELHFGNALEIIPTLKPIFDLVFIDADKINYSNYFDLVIEKLPHGAYIIADNMLWSGKVIDPTEKQDADTAALVAFAKKVQADPRVENVLFPVRDGLMVMRKI